MDGSRFDSLTRSFAQTGSRRRLIGGLIGGAVGLVGLRQTEAAECRELGHICRENANCCSLNCLPPDALHRRRCGAAPTTPPPTTPPPPTTTPTPTTTTTPAPPFQSTCSTDNFCTNNTIGNCAGSCFCFTTVVGSLPFCGSFPSGCSETCDDDADCVTAHGAGSWCVTGGTNCCGTNFCALPCAS